MISKLIKGREARESYIRSKLSVLLPAQIRSLRLRREMKQADLGAAAEMKQGRISVLERIGEASFSIETLIKLASAFRAGLIVRFAPMSEMLAWENSFMPDEFDVVPLENDAAFLNPVRVANQREVSRGLCDAMSGEADNTLRGSAVCPMQGASASLWWQDTVVGSSSLAGGASSISIPKAMIGPASMSASLNQNTFEQGNAA